MVASIPASAIVNVIPNVIDAGGSALDLTGLILTASTRVPIGTVISFTSATDVSGYFGPVSTEALLASIYFAGYDGSITKPAFLLFSQYPTAAVPAYLRGAQTNLTLAQLQALAAGTISLTIDGRNVTSGSINLASASSFSNAATIIQTALADQDATFTAAISGTTMTVSAVASGTLSVGQTVLGGATIAGTVITALGTGTGGTGTYTVNQTQTVASGTLTAGPTLVTFDSVSGAFVITAGRPGAAGAITVATSALATSLGLSAAAGAVTSQGADVAVPATAMDAVTAQTQDFASFMTLFKPSVPDMVAFATWNGTQNDRYLYVMQDNDTAAVAATDTTSAMHLIRQLEIDGTFGAYDPANAASLAAFVMGVGASINYAQPNGRITFAFRKALGAILPGVTNRAVGDRLITNGYNFYGAYATANERFVFLYPGQMSGAFAWADSYVNQIQLNAGLQLALMDLLTNSGRIPYNPDGYGMIEAAMGGVVTDGLTFGSITPNVTLSQSQAAQVNALAGRAISDTLGTRGWYILVSDPGAQVRAARGSPIVFLFYCDGQAVQKITVSSTEIE